MLGSLQDAVRIFHGEEAFVAEDVHEIGIFGRLRQHVDDGLDIFLVGIAPPHGVSSQESAFDGGGNVLPDAADYAQHLEFIGRIEPVAAFDFQRHGAFGHHFLHPAQ